VTAPLLAVLVVCSALRAPPGGGGTPPPPATVQGPPASRADAAAVDVVEKLGEHVPGGLRFVDPKGHEVALATLFRGDKPVVLSLVYFDCPMLCSLVQKGLVKALDQTGLVLGEDYSAITVSFSPRDTPQKAGEAQRGYLGVLAHKSADAEAKWPFLTGRDPEITAVADALGFQYRWDVDSQQYEHPAVSMVLAPDGKISRYLYGIEFDARDLRLALVEASQGRVGTTLDRVLLKCFRYDPAARGYRLVAMNFVRAGAFCVFLALAAGLAILWRQEAKRRHAR
jgi:protein SCO1